MGWSQSDLARHLQVEVGKVNQIENGNTADFDWLRSRLTLYWRQAESLADEVQLSALAEKMIEDQNLSQLFQSELQDKYIE
jgi:transcriptional regulator with XRE-family HTH domain